MSDIDLTKKTDKKVINTLSFEQYVASVNNIDRACSSVIENAVSIFLPLKRLDKSKVHDKFMKNNQTLVVKNNIFDKVEIKGRLLGQIHKDVIESLLTMKKTFSKTTTQFKVETTAYNLLKRMDKDTSDKQWVLKKIEEIKQCGIKLFYKNSNSKEETFDFSFISSIRVIDNKKIEVVFSQEYTYFMAHNELLDYSAYIPKIMSITKKLKAIEKEIGLKNGINKEFIKAVVRYMLINSGNNSYRKIETLVDELDLESIVSEDEIKNCLTDLRRPKVLEMLEEDFGISLTSNNGTLKIDLTDKEESKYILKPTLNLK